MDYTPLYDGADVSSVAIDFAVTVLIVFVAFGSIIAVVLFANWVSRQTRIARSDWGK